LQIPLYSDQRRTDNNPLFSTNVRQNNEMVA
jgi:hypothetical protein